MCKRVLPSITILALLIGTGFLGGDARAAVPVEVVEFSMGTNFEESMEKFMFNLFNELQKRDQDFTAAFELQKIEKAREDVNKLIFKTEEELRNLGVIYNAGDPRTGIVPLVSYKDGRIIRNLSDYFYEEPIKNGRIFLMCYFNFLIWDQGENNKATYGPPGATRYENSVNALAFARANLIVEISRDQQFIVNEPRFLTTFGWPVASNLDGPDGAGSRNRHKKNCGFALSSFASGIQPGAGADEIAAYFGAEQLESFYPTLNDGIAWNNNWTWVDFLKTARRDQNESINDVVSSALAGAKRVISETRQIRNAEYIAGQGIRPEKLYLGLERGAGDPIPYYFETEYVISPAVILLQKMQAATQAQFDLAQKAYLNMPWWTPNSVLGDYNLKEVASTAIYNKDGVSAGSLLPHIAPNVPQNPLVPGTLEFKSTTGSQLWGGLPAPWEDQYEYLRLSGEYKIQNFLLPPEPQGKVLDNIGQENILRHDAILSDFYLNEWFVNVIEMYKSRKPASCNFAGNLDEFGCLLSMWFLLPPEIL